MALTTTDGYAEWYQVFSSKRTPPTVFSQRNVAVVPARRPLDTSAYGTTTHAEPIQPSPSKMKREDTVVDINLSQRFVALWRAGC